MSHSNAFYYVNIQVLLWKRDYVPLRQFEYTVIFKMASSVAMGLEMGQENME